MLILSRRIAEQIIIDKKLLVALHSCSPCHVALTLMPFDEQYFRKIFLFKGQKLLLTPDVSVKLLHAEKNRARLGFIGPAHIVIDREEIAVKKAQQLSLKSFETDFGVSL